MELSLFTAAFPERTDDVCIHTRLTLELVGGTEARARLPGINSEAVDQLKTASGSIQTIQFIRDLIVLDES